MAKQVTSGEKFRFGARTYNDMNRLIDKDRQQGLSMQGRPADGLADGVLVKNISGVDVGRFGILGIAGILFDPATALPAFTARTVFTGQLPAESHQAGRFLICAEPLRSGAIGRAWADGIVTVRINVQDESHLYATVNPDDTTQLISAAQGICNVLYKESGTGTKWAVVRIGSSGSNALRWAFLNEEDTFTSWTAYLDKNLTGDLVTVTFTLTGGATSTANGHYTLSAGLPVPVMKLNDQWRCLYPLQGVDICTPTA